MGATSFTGLEGGLLEVEAGAAGSAVREAVLGAAVAGEDLAGAATGAAWMIGFSVAKFSGFNDPYSVHTNNQL